MPASNSEARKRHEAKAVAATTDAMAEASTKPAANDKVVDLMAALEDSLSAAKAARDRKLDDDERAALTAMQAETDAWQNAAGPDASLP